MKKHLLNMFLLSIYDYMNKHSHWLSETVRVKCLPKIFIIIPLEIFKIFGFISNLQFFLRIQDIKLCYISCYLMEQMEMT